MSNPPIRRTVATAVALWLAPAAAPAQTPTDRWEPIRTAARQFVLEPGSASVSIAVAKNGKIIYEEAFGWANREKLIPADPNTMYSLASISKPFTATGLMTLVQAGKVKLDTPINDYLGTGKLAGLAGDAAAATVRRVLSHTSGLPEHYQFFYANEPDNPVPTRDETIRRYGILVAPPGEVYQYSNLGFGILDYVIERASGQAYADYMRTEVFHPLGLNHTSIYIGPGLEPYAATRYGAKGVPIPLYQFDHPGASAVYSSAHDLVRFGAFHLKNRRLDQRQILADSLLDLMQRRTTPGATGNGYGLGWGIDTSYYGLRSVSHSGGMPGVSTNLALFPSENLAVVVLTNGENWPGRIFEDVVGTMVPRIADSLRVARARKDTAPAPKPLAIPAAWVGTWEGTVRTYDSTMALKVSIAASGDQFITLGSGPRTLLNDASFDEGTLFAGFPGIIPTADARRRPGSLGIQLRLAGDKLRGALFAYSSDTPYIYYALAAYSELTRAANQ